MAGGCLTIMTLTNCESRANNGERVAAASDDVVQARQNRVQAQRDSVADCQTFMAKSEEKVRKNDQVIADFNVRIMTGEKAMKARYQKRLNELKKKNNNMRSKLEQYAETGTDNCEVFRREWNDDMDKIVKSLQSITENYQF